MISIEGDDDDAFPSPLEAIKKAVRHRVEENVKEELLSKAIPIGLGVIGIGIFIHALRK